MRSAAVLPVRVSVKLPLAPPSVASAVFVSVTKAFAAAVQLPVFVPVVTVSGFANPAVNVWPAAAAVMSGAVRLTAVAALRVGAGLVSVATHPSTAAQVSAARPEIMVHGVRDAADLIGLLARATVIAIGPGLGQSSWALALFACVRESRQPAIFDADALSLLALDPDSNAARIITPHPGEAARLLGGITTRAIAHDHFAAAHQLHTRYGGAVVLKGAGTIVQSSGVTQVIRGGNPGMATGGMGDALTGVIAGLLAQGMALTEAAVAGAALHAAAADCAAAAGERGLLASDLMPHLRALVN